MSRSYNKVMGYRDRNPYMKKVYNRSFRRKNWDEDTAPSKGNFHKKVNCPYDICDWRCNDFNLQEFIEDCKGWWNCSPRLRKQYRDLQQYIDRSIHDRINK